MVQANGLAARASPRTVCVIDTGYDINHEGLPQATGYDGEFPWNYDGYGHGTRT